MNIYIITGPVGSGKTSALKEVCRTSGRLTGILSPVIDGHRYFENIETGEQWLMETQKKEGSVLAVGKFNFSEKAFEKASDVIEKLMAHKVEWIVLDEIGPLELNGKGFYQTVIKMIEMPVTNVVFVIREGLVERVKEHFCFNDVQVVQQNEIQERIKNAVDL